jgi:hypothetical protein
MDGFRDDDEVCSPCGTLLYVAPEVKACYIKYIDNSVFIWNAEEEEE